MTDNEIIKALECCSVAKTPDDCERLGCPCFSNPKICIFSDENVVILSALDLINRQKAEIERLTYYNENLQCANTDILGKHVDYIKEARVEAYKEFAERLKGWALAEYENPERVLPECVFVSVESINDLLEEMTEETK